MSQEVLHARLAAGLDLVEAQAKADREAGRIPHANALEQFVANVIEYRILAENGYKAVLADCNLYRERSEKSWELQRILRWVLAQADGRVHTILGDVMMGKTFAQALEANPEPPR